MRQDDKFDEPTARAMIETLYRDLSHLSHGIDDVLQFVQGLTGMIREQWPGDPEAEALADAFAELGQAVGGNLSRVTTLQARLREFGVDPTDRPR
jgi:hypothetical protein